MTCPHCNTKMVVQKGRGRENTAKCNNTYYFGNIKVREYDCLVCNNTIGTAETVIKDFKKK